MTVNAFWNTRKHGRIYYDPVYNNLVIYYTKSKRKKFTDDYSLVTYYYIGDL